MVFLIVGYALAFLGALEFLVFFPDWYGASFLVLGIVLFGVQRVIVGGFSKKSALTLCFGFFAWILLLFIDNETEQHIFAMLAAALFGMVLWAHEGWRKDRFKTSEKGIFSAGTLATVFLFFSVISGVMVNYAFPILLGMAGMGLGTYLLMRQYFFGAIADDKRAKTYAAISGIFFAETTWMIQFWPFGYLTTAAILLIFFFVLWDAFDSYSEGGISWHRMGANFLILLVLTGLLLVTTRWTPLA